MTAGNIFTLQINDGKQDALLNATETMIKRLRTIQKERLKESIRKIAAKLVADAEADPGNLKTEAAIKAFKADPLSYCEAAPQAIYPVLRELSVSHTSFINSQWKPFVALAFTYLKTTEREGNPIFDSTVSFKINQEATWISDQVLHVRLTGFRALAAPDRVKYCELLGHRLLESVQFKIAETIIAEYGTEDINKYFNFDLATNKMSGWLRNVGQETPHLGFLTTEPKAVNFREYRYFGDGPQTLKTSQDDVDMWIPLLFWFNTDIAQAFPNCKIPYGNVKVSIKLRKLSDLIAVNDYGGGGGFVPPSISTLDLYTNHIQTLPEVAEQVLTGYDFTLIRTNKRVEMQVNQPTGEIHLKDLKFPVEALFATFRPLANLDDIDNWHRGSFLTPVTIPQTVVVGTPAPNTIAINYAIFNQEDQTVDDLALKINDIEIYPQQLSKFSSSYLPWAADQMNCPKDCGWHLFNLCVKYNSWNPSGHINMTRNRELYLKYTSSRISDTSRAKLYVVARTINFLMIRGNTAYAKFV